VPYSACHHLQRKEPVRKSTPQGETLQAQYVRDFYTLAFSHPAVEAIVWWSVSDYGAWRGSAAGLLNKNMEPKPAYAALDELINHEWRSSKKTKIDEDGRISFRGFHGDYSVTAMHNGKELAGTFHQTSLRAGFPY